MGTLSAHLKSNGHEDAPNGSLLLKLDIETEEWDVLSSADQYVLWKFRHIVVEFHTTYMHTPVSAKRLAPRVAALENVLRSFVVVHVHPNNACPSCLEVTFSNRD